MWNYLVNWNLLKMLASQIRHWVRDRIIHQLFATLHFCLALLLDGNGLLNWFTDCQFAGTLANFSDVCARETHSDLGQIGQIHIGGNWRFAQRRIEDGQSAWFIRKRDVNQLVQPARTKNGRINYIRAGNLEKLNWVKKLKSNRLVAPMMKTFFFDPMPSISVRTWLMTRSAAPPASPRFPPRDLAIESSSSKKRTQGAAARALSKTSRTLASDSPNHIVSNSGPCELFCM